MSGPPQMTPEQQRELEEKIKNMSPEELREFQKQQCIFCQIIAKKIPAKIVHEDKECLAVLDINPAAKGHILLLPKEHYAIMPQVPDQTIAHMFSIAKDLSQVMLKVLKVSGTSIFIANGPAAGQRAQHFIIHVIPRKEGDGVLDLPLKVIPKDLPGKVKAALQEKIYTLLGEKMPAKQTTIPEVEAKEEATKEEKEEEKPEKEEKGEPKEEKGKKPEKEKKETKAEKSTKKEEVNLDDIANLFK